MKKVLLGLMLCNIVLANSDSSEVTVSKENYSGWYVGAGASYQYMMSDAYLDDNLGRFVSVDAHKYNLLKMRKGKTGGALTAGYGNFITGNCYLGLDLTLDITGSKSSHDSSEVYGLSIVETRGIVPTVVFKLGGYIPYLDSMVYARAGVTVQGAKYRSIFFKDQGFTNNKISPVLGLGLEKNVFGCCNIRIEGDYRFASDKKKLNLKGYDNSGLFDPDYNASIKGRVRGYAVRVMGTYYFK